MKNCRKAEEERSCQIIWAKMSNVAQMEDDLSYMKDFKSLSEAEQEVIKQAVVP